jgi:uncharacterized protein
VKASGVGSRRVVVIDAGPLVAAIDANDRHHQWARSALPRLSARVVTCEAVVAEVGHLLDNHPVAIEALHGFLRRIEIVPMLREDLDAVFALMKRFAPQMDIADACLMLLAARYAESIVLTTDTRDFSSYRIPFASPEGLFATW